MRNAAIVFAIAIVAAVSVAMVGGRQWNGSDHNSAVKAPAGSCCPADSPKNAVSTTQDKGSCPYMSEKQSKPGTVEQKQGPMTKTEKPCAKSATTSKCPMPESTRQAASSAATKSVAKPVVTQTAPRPAPKPTVEPVERKVESAVCPVMGGKIEDVSKAAGSSVYKGKTYYFCCAGCKPLFDKDPAKYAGN